MIIVATANGIGSFVGKSDNQSFLLVEGFMAVITFTGVLVVAVRAQQRAAEIEPHRTRCEQRSPSAPPKSPKNGLLEEKDRRINEDLVVARTLQAAILPTDFDSYDDRCRGGDAAGLRDGGRFLRCLPHRRPQLGLVVGNVSGKGVAAAFFMAVARTTLRDIAKRGVAPADCVARVNETLCVENPIDMFVDLFYAELDEATCRDVTPGLCEPVIASAGGCAAGAHRRSRVLGIVTERRFSTGRFTLAPDETFFLYTAV